VHSITASVSLASWSQSGVYRTLRHIYERKIVLDKIEDPKEKVAGFKVYMEGIVESIYGEGSFKSFVQKLVDTRWTPLKKIFESLDCHGDLSVCDTGNFIEQSGFLERFAGDITYAVERFNHPQGLEVRSDRLDVQYIREFEIGDYLETIAAEVVGARKVYSFLKYCILQLK